jgi:hypothetical protein
MFFRAQCPLRLVGHDLELSSISKGGMGTGDTVIVKYALKYV